MSDLSWTLSQLMNLCYIFSLLCPVAEGSDRVALVDARHPARVNSPNTQYSRWQGLLLQIYLERLRLDGGPCICISGWSRKGSTSLCSLSPAQSHISGYLLLQNTYTTPLNYLKCVYPTLANGLCSLDGAAAGTSWGGHGIIESENHLD